MIACLEIIIVNKALALIVALLLSACASDYQVNTNLDRQNFENYFKPSSVIIYNADTLPEGSQRLTDVTGTSCQATPEDVPASGADARTQARIKAADVGANALVIDVCDSEVDTRNPNCSELITCFGRAFLTPAGHSQ